jgi:hypothetical protein
MIVHYFYHILYFFGGFYSYRLVSIALGIKYVAAAIRVMNRRERLIYIRQGIEKDFLKKFVALHN